MSKTSLFKNEPPWWFGVFCALVFLCPAQAADVAYSLSGRIMDTSDNWLPDVRVTLTKTGVSTQTDGNGLFQLHFTSKAPLIAGPDGKIDTLELTKPGFGKRTIAITNPTYFTQPVSEKLEPNPVATDTISLKANLPLNHSIHGLPGVVGADSRDPITGEKLHEALKKVASRGDQPAGEAEFHAYIPRPASPLRAAFLISLHGMGSVDHPALRRFADQNQIALVGVKGPSIQRGCYPLDLLDAPLERLGKLTGHPELATVPVLTFGHSNGTGFATVYAAGRPDRLIGWISYHSGYAWQLLLPGVEAAPGLVMHGHLDTWLQHGQEQAVKDLRRLRKAPVAMMLEANVGHGPVDANATWEFIVAFCQSVLRTRLGADGKLRPIALERGWLGGIYNRNVGGQQKLPIAAYRDFAGNPDQANWLPDRGFAEVWQQYGQTNPKTKNRPAPP